MSDRPLFNDVFKSTVRDAEPIYFYFFNCVKTDPPVEVIANFRRVFIEGRDYRDASVREALEKIVLSKQAEKDFTTVLYQSCQIAIQHWFQKPELLTTIVELVALFEQLPTSQVSIARLSSRCLQLSKNFVKTEPYIKLKRLMRVIVANLDKEDVSFSLTELLVRYPYLYKHCLLDEDCNLDYQKLIRKLRSQNQHCFEVTFVRYLIYQMRLLQIARARQLSSGAGRLLRRVESPTLLNGDEVKAALKLFAPKNYHNSATQNLSLDVLEKHKQLPTFKVFKGDLYNYLISLVDPNYGKRYFNKLIFDKLQKILPESHSQKLSEFFVLRTYTQLLNFLIVESRQNLNHQVLTDAIANLGTTQTSNLLLRLLLLYPKIRPHLESRLAILFEHYEFCDRQQVTWLIKILENFNISIGLHFGSLDLSALKLYNENK
jgi:hypothetical protein